MDNKITMENEKLIREAIQEAKDCCHPPHIGLTEKDRYEIKAYLLALKNLEHFLTEKGVLTKQL